MDIRGLDEFMKEYWEAGSSRDFNKVAGYLHETASFYFSEGAFNGFEQIKKAFENTWAAILNEVYTTGNIRWIIQLDEFAVCTYEFKSEGFIDKTRRTLNGLGTNILLKEAGEWKIVHEHLSVTSRE